MSDTFTQQSTFSTDTAAYEMLAYFALRPQLLFDAVADVKPTHQSHRGSSVSFPIYTDLTAQTSALSETTDPDSIAASDAFVTVTLAEQGAVIKTTAKIRATSFLDIDSDMANLIGYNAGLSIDTLARTPINAGSNVRYAPAVVAGVASGTVPPARNQVTIASTMTAAAIRRARTDLVNANVAPSSGSYYWAFIHPDVVFDLQMSTGTAGWVDPHVYSAVENIWSGEFGAFSGFRFVETPRCVINTDAGSSPTTTDVYATYFGGRQALAMAYSDGGGYSGRYPTVVLGPKIDALQRIQPVGWKWFGAYARFREEALRRVESASSIGAN